MAMCWDEGVSGIPYYKIIDSFLEGELGGIAVVLFSRGHSIVRLLPIFLSLFLIVF